MSYFPSPDPQKLRSAYYATHAVYRTPPTPTLSDSVNGPSGPNSRTSQSFYTAPHSPWSTSEPQGLGLLSLPIREDRFPQYSNVTTQPMSSALSWPSDFTVSQPSTAMMHDRMDSWNGSCNPMSTLLPAALWEPTQQPAGFSAFDDHASPGRSEYSTSTHASCMSSPYTHSDSFLRTAGSPMIKLEEPTDIMRPRVRHTPEQQPFSESMLVTPSDLFTTPITPFDEQDAMPAIIASSSDVEAKPAPRPLRPAHRRAFSSEDVRGVLSEDRQKRGFTKPENASCHCKQCGKLFQRSYNLKAHMETHAPGRIKPHTCQYAGCGRDFVRRTDLARHQQSVSIY